MHWWEILYLIGEKLSINIYQSIQPKKHLFMFLPSLDLLPNIDKTFTQHNTCKLVVFDPNQVYYKVKFGKCLEQIHTNKGNIYYNNLIILLLII